MTEEPSVDGERDAEDGPDEERSEDAREESGDTGEGSEDEERSADELASARSDEEPDVEAAKAELEAVGATDEQDEDSAPDGAESPVTEAASSGEAEADSPDDGANEPDSGDETAGEDGADDDPNPEDLVRDPDEPQVTSSLEEQAAETETNDAASEPSADADSRDETETVGDEAAETDGEAPEARTAGEDSDADAETASNAETTPDAESDDTPDDPDTGPDHQPGVPDDVQKYDRFKKVDGSQYDRVNEFLRDRTYITAREWAIARLCSDFRTETGVEMTKIGENLPELVPFMTDTYTPQAVNQARSSFEDKVRTAGATFLYGAMCDFFTAEELDDVMYESTEVAKFLLEVEGVELSVEDELEAEDRISAVMREVRSSSAELRHERCPDCGAELTGDH